MTAGTKLSALVTRKVLIAAGLVTLCGRAPLYAQYQNQMPSAPAMPAKKFMTKSVFYLPVKVDERVRATLKEVRLYVKDDSNKGWLLQDKVAPTQTYFTFRAPREGEYWFAVVTVDKMGKSVPSDLRNEGPGVIVVLDSQPPQVEVRPLPESPEGACFQCLVHDSNPDLTKTRVYYQSGDMEWRTLDPHPAQMDRFCVPQQAVCTGMVRVEAVDLAGNNTRKEFNIGAGNLARAPMPQSRPVREAQDIKQVSFTNSEEVSRSARPRSLEQALPQVNPQANQQAGPYSGQSPAPFPIDRADESSGPGLNGPELAPAMPSGVHTARANPQRDLTPEQPAIGPAPAPESAESTAGNRQVVGKNHIVLDYQIDNKGPSGVGKVEVWTTRDQGKSWQKICEDADHKSPVEIDLPSEGVYGVNLVVSNGRGFGGTPPRAGDAPEMIVEVDHTKPTAEIVSIQPGVGGNAGCLLISWNASDKNLASEPIDLYYASNRQGPWRPIVRGLANSGQYRWLMPSGPAGEAYVRLVAHDSAGNSTQVETPQPVVLDDQSRPRARVTSVSTTAAAEER